MKINSHVPVAVFPHQQLIIKDKTGNIYYQCTNYGTELMVIMPYEVIRDKTNIEELEIVLIC